MMLFVIIKISNYFSNIQGAIAFYFSFLYYPQKIKKYKIVCRNSNM